ncbi:MAG: hypothetical protein JXQ29_12905 [Planctomycetes bacterium]|nr:hypothetical protein [Planctomycetota bacterium]
MPTDDLDPHDILSLVEGECIRDRVTDAAMAEGEARALRRRIGRQPGAQARYEDLRLSVTALSRLPRLDAPQAVWQRLEARFEAALAEGRARARAQDPRPRGAVVVLRRIAAAAACLLVVGMAAAWLLAVRLGLPESAAPTSRVTFVSARLEAPAAGVAIGEFLTRTTQRYQGMSPEVLQRILGHPATGQ